ncbi:NUMOD4 domain-containing protein [Paucilactobacillus kaifaensis]|uniref:NUMOD4 domain-containing protein n=1 Tax=Paucilactobacillus kaifaensis TaxID=2559921 RepID=UPI0010F5A168|nr:NUMOD4 domain-containing protein [Paucilactobacillus kaifaensis]
MNNETWKNVIGYENKYEVSTFGRVRNAKTGHVLKPWKNWGGYLLVDLYGNHHTKHFSVHKLVAGAFLGEKPNEDYQVNHIDEHKDNNDLSNLEYCSPKYNADYGTRGKRIAISQGVPIYVITETNKRIYCKTISEACRKFNLSLQSVRICLKGERQSHKGYKFEYATSKIHNTQYVNKMDKALEPVEEDEK